MNKGIGYAMGAYLFWGLFPIYWKWLQHVPALQLICHRILWSCIMLAGMLGVTGQWGDFRSTVLQWRIVGIYSVAALLVSVNWLVYVWGVNAGYVVETSLGYFINPLVSVLLGVVFLRERLRPWQWLPVVMAAAGVVYLTLALGKLPWIGLAVAFSFGCYGLVKKVAPLGSVYGLALETGILLVPALLYLLYCEWQGLGAFLHGGALADWLMIGAGLVTTLPMLLFTSAARRIPLSQVGMLQYIAPTMQFLLGVLVYREPFSPTQFVGFGIVWVALIVFVVESLVADQLRQRLPVFNKT